MALLVFFVVGEPMGHRARRENTDTWCKNYWSSLVFLNPWPNHFLRVWWRHGALAPSASTGMCLLTEYVLMLGCNTKILHSAVCCLAYQVNRTNSRKKKAPTNFESYMVSRMREKPIFVTCYGCAGHAQRQQESIKDGGLSPAGRKMVHLTDSIL